mgnify:CR=1 FL=1
MRPANQDKPDEQARPDRSHGWARGVRRARTKPSAGYSSGVRRRASAGLCVHDDCPAAAHLAGESVDNQVVVQQPGDAISDLPGRECSPDFVLSLCDSRGEKHAYVIGEGQWDLAESVVIQHVMSGVLEPKAGEAFLEAMRIFRQTA